MTIANQRRDARHAVRLPVAVLRGREATFVEAIDASFRGVFLTLAAPPPIRSLVRLRIGLPSGALETHGMVIHVTSGHAPALPGEATRAQAVEGVGLEFWGLSGIERGAWEMFIREVAAGRLNPKAGDVIVHPAASEPSTPSGVRVVGPEAPLATGLPPRASTRR